MSMRDRWTSDLHEGSPQGLPSSKWRFSKQYHRDYFARWFWQMWSWFNKMCTLGPRGHFFVIDTDGLRRSHVKEARSAEEKELSISTGLFHLMYFEDGPLEPGCKMCSLQNKKTLTRSPQKRSRPDLTYHELLSNFIFLLDLDNIARCSACRIALTSSK